MINTKHLLKVTSVWISVVYAVCFTGVAMFTNIRPVFMRYALHMEVDMGRSIVTLGTFISGLIMLIIGLIIWNIIALLAVWLFAFLYNKIKQ